MMQPPKWTERYNCHSLRLAQGAISIGVNWSTDRKEPGFRVSVNGVKLAQCITGLPEAKQAGLDLARKMLQHATYELDLLRMAAS